MGDNIDNESFQNLWYTRADYKELKDEANHVSFMIENGKIKDDNVHYTIRGIEKHGSNSRKRIVDNAFQSVMREQKSQKLKGVVDPNAISNAYFDNGAKKCADDAHKMGIYDEQAVAAFEILKKKKEINSLV